MLKRQIFPSGAPWEDIYGYSRAVRVGNFVTVSGTTATDEYGNIEGDISRQTDIILQKITTVLEQAGAKLKHVTRTRTYIINMDDWPRVADMHNRYFGNIKPAASLVEVRRLIDPRMLVEIEVDAIIPE